MALETDLLHLGSRITGKHDTPEIEPVYFTNAFNVPDLDVLDYVYDGGGFAYNRTCNPNRALLAELITGLEGRGHADLQLRDERHLHRHSGRRQSR